MGRSTLDGTAASVPTHRARGRIDPSARIDVGGATGGNPTTWKNVWVEIRPAAAEWADQQIDSVRDHPAGRLALIERTYRGPFGAPRVHLPYRRAAMSFMRWQLRRGVLAPPHSPRPGSPWWRSVNERLLRDGCEAMALSGGLDGSPSSRPVDFWMAFADRTDLSVVVSRP